jgi:nicotinamidase-related amidase
VDRFVNPALVIVDMQNDFVRQGAPLEVPQARDTIALHQRLIAACRARSIPIVYTKFLAGPKHTLIWEWSPVLAPPVCCCWKGHKRRYGDTPEELDGSEIIAELSPQAGDWIVEKYGYGAFHQTNLHAILQAHHVQSVLVTGTVTQICVEETAREAFHYGYLTTMIADAVSSFAPDLHQATLKNFAMKFGWVSNGEEVLRALQGMRTQD